MKQGYIHVYTGNGKGKTTAAFGMALRAVGAGKKVYIGQFVKSQIYSEVRSVLEFLPGVQIKQFGLDCFIFRNPTQEDIDAARKGLEEVTEVINSGKYDIVILDEANIALYYKLFAVDELIQVLMKKPAETEIIVTGRYAPEEIIDIADLVTEMQEIKHYYKKGIKARVGIEC